MTWLCLTLFCVGFSAACLATPTIISLAHSLGAVDSPDGFRKNHRQPTPRMGGIAVVFGVGLTLLFLFIAEPALFRQLQDSLTTRGLLSIGALLIVLAIGILDDRHDLRPMVKLVGQAVAGGLLFVDGFAISKIFLLGVTVDFGWLSLPATLFWFLACMNIWNLIDGMDGLASGVGMIVALTLMLAADVMGNMWVACLAAGLAGSLAGFLIFNFHPARIFLGDTGSLFIGTILGMLAIRGSLKSGMTVAILIPILAMGLPIVDTALAIVRRWIRHLPWSVADRGHLHHRLMAFGLNPRQASLFLYSFTLVLCTAALAGISLQSDMIAVVVAILGAIGLTFVFFAQRDDAANSFVDIRRRFAHRRVEQRIARIVWESIQRLPNADGVEPLVNLVDRLGQSLACDRVRLRYKREGRIEIDQAFVYEGSTADPDAESVELSFRLGDWEGEELLLSLAQRQRDDLPLTLGGRFISRLHRELLVRLRQVLAETPTTRLAARMKPQVTEARDAA